MFLKIKRKRVSPLAFWENIWRRGWKSHQYIPFESEVPNKGTQEAMTELEASGDTKYHRVDAMFKDIGI